MGVKMWAEKESGGECSPQKVTSKDQIPPKNLIEYSTASYKHNYCLLIND